MHDVLVIAIAQSQKVRLLVAPSSRPKLQVMRMQLLALRAARGLAEVPIALQNLQMPRLRFRILAGPFLMTVGEHDHRNLPFLCKRPELPAHRLDCEPPVRRKCARRGDPNVHKLSFAAERLPVSCRQSLVNPGRILPARGDEQIEEPLEAAHHHGILRRVQGTPPP